MTTGELRLKVKNVHNRMLFDESYVSGAFKLGKPIWCDGIPLYYLLHVGGGYVSGDEYVQQIELRDHTTLYLTTQAATKVYKGDHPAKVHSNIKIGQHSHLSLLQDPIIMYENAMFHQHTVVELTKTSTFYFSEIITPGWSPSKEPFQYKELYSELRIKRDGKLCYADRLFWQRDMQPQYLQLADYSHYGTFLCIEALPTTFFEAFEQWQTPGVEIGYSLLQDYGFVLKIAAFDTQQIEAIFQQLDDLLRAEKCREPLRLRKY